VIQIGAKERIDSYSVHIWGLSLPPQEDNMPCRHDKKSIQYGSFMYENIRFCMPY
jgi:hypothetical protein